MSTAQGERSIFYPIAVVLVVACNACTCGDTSKHERRPAQRMQAPTEAPDGLSEAEWGERLFRDLGCIGCHNVNGVRGVGGALNGMRGQPRELADGTTVVATDDYIRESIVRHDAKIVTGFERGVAPQYEGRISALQMSGLVTYIRGLE